MPESNKPQPQTHRAVEFRTPVIIKEKNTLVEQAAELAAAKVRKDPKKVLRAQTLRGKALNTVSSTCRSTLLTAGTIRLSRYAALKTSNLVHAKRCTSWSTQIHERAIMLNQALQSCKLMAQLEFTEARNALRKAGHASIVITSGESLIDTLSTFIVEHPMSTCMLSEETVLAICAVWKASSSEAKQKAYSAMSSADVLKSALSNVQHTQMLIDKKEKGEQIACPLQIQRSCGFVPVEAKLLPTVSRSTLVSGMSYLLPLTTTMGILSSWYVWQLRPSQRQRQGAQEAGGNRSLWSILMGVGRVVFGGSQ